MSDLIEDLTDFLNGHLDSWDEKPVLKRAIAALKAAEQRIDSLEKHESLLLQSVNEKKQRIEELSDKAASFEGSFNAALKEIDRLDAALNVAVNGITELSRGYDIAGTKLDSKSYAKGLLDYVTNLWEKKRILK